MISNAGSVKVVAVISDIHGNFPALDAVLAEPDVATADVVVVAGDHAAGPQPNEVLDRLRSLGERSLLLRGNADREMVDIALGRGSSDEDEVSTWAASQLSVDNLEMLEALPHPIVKSVNGFGSVLFCHGSPRHEDDVVVVDSRLERWKQMFEGLNPAIRTVVCGHTHMPFMRLVNGSIVINPGSVGMPYGRPGGSWAVLSNGAITFGHTPIDANRVARQITEASTFPDVNKWVREYVTQPSTDVEAFEVFGPLDGR